MSYSAEVLADSPLAYYRLGEGSGTTAVDSSGNSRNATWGGSGPTYTTGLLTGDSNGAIKPNGVQAAVGNAAWMDVTTFTVEAWVKIDTLTSGAIVDRYGGGTTGVSSFILYMPSNKFSLVVRTAAGDKQVIAPTAITTGVRYHVVGTCDGTNLKLFINNSEVSSIASGPAVDGEANLLLGRFDFGNVYTIGTIDEVAIYGTALSTDRIAAHYNAGSSESASFALTSPKVTAAISASYLAPISASLALESPAVETSISATYAGPVDATLDLSAPALSFAIAAQYDPEPIEASFEITLPMPTLAISASKRVFVPPTSEDHSDDYFFGRYGVPVGLSVIKRDGHYETVPYPWLGEIAGLTEGSDWFQGGRTYDINSATAAALLADGYTLTEV